MACKRQGCSLLPECEKAPPRLLLKAVGEFNRGECFECHETLEDLWTGESGELRDLYQGVLQIAVAMHHWRNGNYKGAVSLLAGGITYLRRVCSICMRIDVAGLIGSAERARAGLAALGSEGMAGLPPEMVPRLRLIPPGTGLA